MDKWRDENMLEFARIASSGTYGKYKGCRTLVAKLARYKIILTMEKFDGFQSKLLIKGLELAVQELKDKLKEKNEVLYTEAYIDTQVEEILVKLFNFSKKEESEEQYY